MRQNILDRLTVITEEEREILNGQKNVRQDRYTLQKDFIVDSGRLLRKGQLIMIRPHTRFIHFPKHRHNYVEMVYMCTGTTTHIINGTNTITLEEGDLLFLNQYATQEILPAGEHDIAVNFIILPEFFDRTLPIFMNLSSFADTINQDGPDQYEQNIVFSVLKYIETHYKDGTLSEISAELKQPTYYISRLLKKHTSNNFKGLLQQRKLQQAGWLLANTSLPAEDIISAIGYDNSSYFYRIFKEKYGVSPKEYRSPDISRP